MPLYFRVVGWLPNVPATCHCISGLLVGWLLNVPATCHCISGLLVAERPSDMLVYLKDGSAKTIVHVATLR